MSFVPMALDSHDREAAEAFVPRLSLAERDRRWMLVRARMMASGLDVLVLPASTARWEQTMADSRYLTTIGGFGTETLTVFPLEAVPTAYVFNRAEFWKKAQSWVSDVRNGRNRWSENLRERFGELDLGRFRIGVPGLSGLTRTPDGIAPHRMVENLKAALPNAEIVDATQLMLDIRAIKSAEEMALITRATQIAEAMVDTVRELRPGDTERTFYAKLVAVEIALGGELPAMIIVGSGPELEHGNFVPTGRMLQSGDLILGEVEGRYAGYSGQIVRPAVLGKPTPEWRDLLNIAIAVFHDVLGAMTPGTSLGQVAEAYERAVAKHGRGKCEIAYPLMHARGLGDDIPAVIAAEDRVRLSDVPLQEGMAFVLKPRVARGGVPTVQVGDMVMIGANAARRLGCKNLELIEVEGFA